VHNYLVLTLGIGQGSAVTVSGAVSGAVSAAESATESVSAAESATESVSAAVSATESVSATVSVSARGCGIGVVLSTSCLTTVKPFCGQYITDFNAKLPFANVS
jgi:ribosomal protein S5